MSRTSGTTTRINGVFYMRRRKRPNRLAVAWMWWLETLCERTGHVEACLLLNSFRVAGLGNWWHRQWVRTVRAASEWTDWERMP